MTVPNADLAVPEVDLDRVAQAAKFVSAEAVRMHLHRLMERINQQTCRITKGIDGGGGLNDYTVIVEQIWTLTGEALTLAAQLDVLASIARTAKEQA